MYHGRSEGPQEEGSPGAFPQGGAYDEGLDEPLAWTLFLGSSSMEMGKMLSCTVHDTACQQAARAVNGYSV